MRIAPQTQWSDIKPEPVEINEQMDGTVEVIINEDIVQVPDGWKYSQHQIIVETAPSAYVAKVQVGRSGGCGMA